MSGFIGFREEGERVQAMDELASMFSFIEGKPYSRSDIIRQALKQYLDDWDAEHAVELAMWRKFKKAFPRAGN